MPRICKVKSGQVAGLAAHNARELPEYSNDDIELERSEYNMDLTPEHPGFEPTSDRICDQRIEYLNHLRETNICYERPNNVVKVTLKGGKVVERDRGTNVMAEVIVTLPKSVWDMTESLNRGVCFPEGDKAEEVIKFFKTVVDFHTERYGVENIVSAHVHFDEGIKRPIIEKDFFGKDRYEKVGDKFVPIYKKDAEGNILEQYVQGQPHVHIDIAPIMKDGERYFHRWDKHSNSGVDERVISLTQKQRDEGYEGKWAYSHMFNKVEFNTYHPDLQNYLKDHGVDVEILTGKTSINYTVEQLKAGVKDAYEKYMHEHQYERRI